MPEEIKRNLFSELDSNKPAESVISEGNTPNYEEIRNKLREFKNAPQEKEGFISSDILEKIEASLNEYGLVFITGPILTGKSFLLDVIKNLVVKNTLFSTIDKLEVSIHKENIKSTKILYYYWLKAIKKQIEKELSVKIKKPFNFSPNLDLNHKLKDQDSFNTWMNTIGKYGSDLVSFLLILDQIITDTEVRKCFKKKNKYFITCRLDDIQSHAINTVFFFLKEEIANLPKNLNVEFDFSFKLLIATRYLPQITLKQKTVVHIPPFSKQGIEKISYLFDNEFQKMGSSKEDFDDLVYTKTNGYPWFVIRFFHIYLQIRTTKNEFQELPPIELAKKIFEIKAFWTEDSLWNDTQKSTFLGELDALIRKSSETERDEFKNYLSNSGDLNNKLNLNSFSIRQSGFIKIDTPSDIFEENECHILQTHYKEEVKKIIDEVEQV